MPIVNERVAYRSFAGDVWDAVVTNVWDLRDVGSRSSGRGVGYIDIDIVLPGGKEPWPLKAIRWYDDPAEKCPGARPMAGGLGG